MGKRIYSDEGFDTRVQTVAGLWQDAGARGILLTEASPTARSAWTEERVTLLLKVTGEGKSAGEAAKILGYPCSRNAVLGKLFRMQQAGTAIARRLPNTHASKRVEVKAKCLPSLPALCKGPLPTVKVQLDRPAPVNGLLSVLQLTSQTCKWPIGDVGAADFGFCGKPPREKSSYCLEHAKDAKQPAADRRKADTSPPITPPPLNGLRR